MGFTARLGAGVIDRAFALHSIARIISGAITSFVFRFNTGGKATRTVLLKQIYFAGFESVPVISWIALTLGIIIISQLLSILPKFGGEGLIGDVLVWVVVREVAPLFSAVLLIARSGTAIASELGVMKISKEVSSLEAMGIDPQHYLVMPRVIGASVSVFVLTFYFEAVSILGGYLLAGFGKNISFTVYITGILEALGFVEFGVSFLKGALFGLIIGAVCAYHGLRVEKSVTQIPQETTKAVIASLGLVFLTDAVLTFVFFL